MATPADIQNVYDDLRERMMDTEDSTELKKFNEARAKAMTDDQARYNILLGLVGADKEGTLQMPMDTTQAKLYNGWPVREEEIAIPTTANVLSSLSYKDVKDNNGNITKTAQEQFIEDYLKKPKYLVKELEKKNKGFGSKSADILREAFKESVVDVAEQQKQKRIEEVINGTAEDSPWYDKLVGRYILPVFGSRQREAYLRGEDPSLGDYASDFGGNLLMTVPGAGYARAGKVITGALGKAPVLSKAVQLGSKAGTAVASKAPRVANIAGGIASNSVAPVGTEVLQTLGDAVDSDRDANFNTSAALLGTLTNYGVNDILLRKAGQLNKLLLDNEASRAATKQAREALKGAAKEGFTASDMAQAFIVNKLGNNRAAEYAGSRLGISPQTMKELGLNMKEVDNERYPVKEPNLENLEPIDVIYLQKIIENPDIIKDSKDTDFRMWFATRGNELLRGSDYHVPTWEVNF